MSIWSTNTLIAQATQAVSQTQGVGTYQLLEPGILPGGGPTTPSFQAYFSSIVGTTLALGAALAVLMIVIGGIQIITSTTPAKMGGGKQKIYNALIGLMIIIISTTLLETINPNLLNLNFFSPGEFTATEQSRPPAIDTPGNPNSPIVPSGSTEFVQYWDFNDGINRQVGDASPELSTVLSCTGERLQQQGIRGMITSISDRNHIGNLETCRDPRTHSRPSCAHGNSGGRGSCHYGGSNVGANKSYAADLREDSNWQTIRSAALACGAVQVINEDDPDHLHLEAPGCR